MCDEDNNGSISKKEFYRVLKLNATVDKDKKVLWRTVQQIYRSFTQKASEELTRKELGAVIRADKNIKSLIEKNMRFVNKEDTYQDLESAKPMQNKVGFYISMSGSSKPKGLYYDEISKLLNAVKEREDLYAKNAKIKQELQQLMQPIKCNLDKI